MASGAVVGGGLREVGPSPASRADYRTAARRRRGGSANGGRAARKASSRGSSRRRERDRLPPPGRRVFRAGRGAAGPCGVAPEDRCVLAPAGEVGVGEGAIGRPAPRRGFRRSSAERLRGRHGRDSAVVTGQEPTPCHPVGARSKREETLPGAAACARRARLSAPATKPGRRRAPTVGRTVFRRMSAGLLRGCHGGHSAAATGQELTP